MAGIVRVTRVRRGLGLSRGADHAQEEVLQGGRRVFGGEDIGSCAARRRDDGLCGLRRDTLGAKLENVPDEQQVSDATDPL